MSIHLESLSQAKYATSFPERIRDRVLRRYSKRPAAPLNSLTPGRYLAIHTPAVRRSVLPTTPASHVRIVVQTSLQNEQQELGCRPDVHVTAAAPGEQHSNGKTDPDEIGPLPLPSRDPDSSLQLI